MSRKSDLVDTIRKLQTVISILIFFLVFAFCWSATDFKIDEIQLSAWGSESSPITYNIWNSVIVLLSVSIMINVSYFIHKHVRLKQKKIPYIFFGFVSLCLSLVGFFSVDYKVIHNLAAWSYFFLFPLAIFTMAYINRESLLYREWFTHLLFSIIMIVLPLTVINLFEGMAIPETLHTITVCVWNIYVAFKNF
jgi:hypothetical membrane protein